MGIDGKLIQFMNCQLLKDHKIVEDDLWVRDGIILNPYVVFFDENIAADIKIDCKGLLISPGYIDVQINGWLFCSFPLMSSKFLNRGFGVDFTSDTESIECGLRKVSKNLLQFGITSFCPTIVTSSKTTYHKLLPKIEESSKTVCGAKVLGLHLEGPFISKEKKGAHREEYVETLDLGGIKKMIDFYGSLRFVKIITMAPEQSFAMEVIKYLVKENIVVSIGHTTASFDIAEDAVRSGARFITHLFNAMLPFHHRDPGVVGLLTSNNPQPIYFGMIADGIHTHPSALRIAHRSHPDGLVLVSDAIAALGLLPGKHKLGTIEVEISENKVTVAGQKTLAGSIASLDYCVRQFKKLAGCSKVEALEAASLHPAQLLKITHEKGTLNYGAEADIILLNENLEVQATFITGTLAWMNEKDNVICKMFDAFKADYHA